MATTYTVLVVENTNKAAFEAAVKVQLELGWLETSQLIITDNGTTRTYSKEFQNINNVI